MAHTKGPWKVFREYNVHNPELNRVVATCGGHQSNQDQEGVHLENIANARLIAAAPDLLEVCKLAKEYLITIAHDPKHSIIQKLEAAIAKAKGEQ